MIDHSRPTRAEVTDVAGACMAGADAVMLSAETASGKYPLEAVAMMDSILRETEAYQFFAQKGRFTRAGADDSNQLHEALGTSAAQLSRDLMVRAVFVLTRSGYTARIISADRPAAPILALTQKEEVRRRLNLLWGVYPFLTSKYLEFAEYLAFGEKLIKKMKLANRDDYVLMLSGLGDKDQTTNSIVVHRIS
jgi:pyruvate kinase